MPSDMMESFFEQLKTQLPELHLSTDPGDCQEYGRDWTRVHEPAPSGVVFPRSTEEVAAIVTLCNAHDVAMVPSGGRTGLAGGAMAATGELVISLSRMTHMSDVDTLAQTVVVQAGAITEAVHHHCEKVGLTWPIDFASKGSSCVGGNIATNAGGVRVIRYGLTREWVSGLTVVTGKGDVLRLGGGLEKNNTGIALSQSFVGSEGILGIITEATLKLVTVPKRQDVLLFAVDSLSAVLNVFESARKGPFLISAFEMFTEACLKRLSSHRSITRPLAQSPYYVLLEVEANDADALQQWLEEVLELVSDGVLSASSDQAKQLWTLREGISESLSATGLPHKNDISLPISSLRVFCLEMESLFESSFPGYELCVFGHIGDGNLHVNVMKPDSMSAEDFHAAAHKRDELLFSIVQKHGGSISAEHGIGLLKRDFLHFTRSETEVALMRSMKQVFDPKGLLNPGKVFV